MAVEWNRQGCTREVILWGRWAFKLPKITEGWRLFLTGLLANMQEREFATTGWPELCPVEFSVPGGWLVVMQRAEPITDQDYLTNVLPILDRFLENDEYAVPAERKTNSFGRLNGRLVVVDYGS